MVPLQRSPSVNLLFLTSFLGTCNFLKHLVVVSGNQKPFVEEQVLNVGSVCQRGMPGFYTKLYYDEESSDGGSRFGSVRVFKI